MKKTAAAAAVLTVGMLIGTLGLAETPDPAVGNTAAAESQTEAVSEDSSFLSWLGEGADMLFDFVSTGWELAGDAAESGMDWLSGKFDEWSSRAETYMKDHQWDVKVEEAWNTLKEGAEHTGAVAQEKLDEAYRTVRDWLTSADETVDQAAADAVDSMAAAAGVAEAKLSGWCRRMDAYMTEKSALVTDAAGDAWDTVRQYTQDAGSVARDRLDEACQTLREWLESVGEGEDSEAVKGLDLITEQE